jgi:hypothetical protein
LDPLDHHTYSTTFGHHGGVGGGGGGPLSKSLAILFEVKEINQNILGRKFIISPNNNQR